MVRTSIINGLPFAGVCDRMTTQSFQTTCSPSPRHLMLLDEVMSTSHGRECVDTFGSFHVT
jgi:hypothetical protein